MRFWQSGDLVLAGFHNLEAGGLARHAIATRLGGSSDPPYRGLNLGLRSGDDPDRVRAHRRAVCAALGLAPERVAAGRQVHGDGIALVDSASWAASDRDFLDADRAIPDTDALATADTGLALFLLVADCTPILLYDPVRPAVAIVHAGWRGTVRRIAGKAVTALAAGFGSRPGDLLAGIGPAIGSCCYEVDEPVIQAVRAAQPEDATDVLRLKPNGRAQLDLAETNRRQLIATGVAPERIETAGICTACTTALFYSERREGRPAGRFGALIALGPEPDRSV